MKRTTTCLPCLPWLTPLLVATVAALLGACAQVSWVQPAASRAAPIAPTTPLTPLAPLAPLAPPLGAVEQERRLEPALPLARDGLGQRQREQVALQTEAAQGGNGSQGHQPNNTVALPADSAQVAAFNFNGGDQLQTRGAGLALSKTLANRYALGMAYGSESRRPAAVDVAAGTAQPQHNRTTLELNAHALVRAALLSLSLQNQNSPDERGRSWALDMAHDLAGGLTTVNLGFTRGSSTLLQTGDATFQERRTNWRYRMGLTRGITPQWLAGVQYEALQDAGYLGNPYGNATVFGATVPERTPSTRGSRAVKLRTAAELGQGTGAGAGLARFQVRGEYRYFWDNWGIQAHTSEWGLGSRFGAGAQWRVDAAVRFHTQRAALFYSDNATVETLYLNRDRRYGAQRNTGFVLGGSYVVGSARPAPSPAPWQAELGASLETRQMHHSDFTDTRTGKPYANTARLLQLNATLRF